MDATDWYANTETADLLRSVSTATLTTQLFKRGLRSRYLRGVVPLRSGTKMLGVARTLRYIPMREDLDTLETLGSRANAQRVLIESIQPGEVLVIDGQRNTGAGSLGGILAMRLQVRGCAGVVTDGAFRDTPSIRSLEMPAYSVAMNANTNLTVYHPADFDIPIGCAGVLVMPGDAVVGDDEGVVVIPSSIADEVASSAYDQEQREEYIYGLVSGGASVFDVYPMNDEIAAKYDSLSADRGTE